MSRLLLFVALAVAAGLVVRRRVSRRARVGIYTADGLLVSVPPVSPAGLELRAAAGDVLRAFATACIANSAGKDA